MSGYAEYCLWVVGLLWAVWALLWAVWASLGYLLEGSGPVGSGGLTSRVCVFTTGSRKVPVHPAESLATLCYKSAPTLQILRMVSAQEDMFVCMRTAARGAARRGSSRRPLQKGQEIETGSSATAS